MKQIEGNVRQGRDEDRPIEALLDKNLLNGHLIGWETNRDWSQDSQLPQQLRIEQ